MSTKPLYPAGVVVTQPDLALESTQRIAEDNQRLVDVVQTGVASGLAATVNGSDATRVDIAIGHGYPPNGQSISVAAPIIAVPLADYTLNVINYITLMYTETSSAPRAHESAGTRANTIETGTFRVVVFTSTQFAALPATTSNLALNALDRALVVALIPGQGLVGATPNDLVYSTWFTADRALSDAIPFTLTLPTTAVVTGVECVRVGYAPDGTAPPLGTGTITLITSTSPATLQWTAPGDSIGATVNVTTAGTYTLVSTDLTTLTVFASPEFFPSSGTYSDAVTVGHTLYGSTGQEQTPELSAEDRRHRKTLGNVGANIANPHGIRGSDISPILRVQQGIISGVGMATNLAHTSIPRYMASINATGLTKVFESLPISGQRMRLYVDSAGTVFETTNASYDEAGALWNKDTEGLGAALRTQTGLLHEFDFRAAASASPWSSWDRGAIMNTNGVFGRKKVVISSTGMNAADAYINGFQQTVVTATTNRWQISIVTDSTTNVSTRRFLVDLGGGAQQIEETVNASWDGTNWNRDVGTYVASKTLTYQDTDQRYSFDATASASWGDGSWVLRAEIPTKANVRTRFEDGRIYFGVSTAGYTNPATGNAIANTICAKNTCKSWGQIITNGSGSPTYNGFNISNVSADDTTGFTTISFATPLSDVNYSVSFGIMTAPSTAPGVSPGNFIDNPYPFQLIAGNISPGGFAVKIVAFNNSGVPYVALATDPFAYSAVTSPLTYSFQVFGQQN